MDINKTGAFIAALRKERGLSLIHILYGSKDAGDWAGNLRFG